MVILYLIIPRDIITHLARTRCLIRPMTISQAVLVRELNDTTILIEFKIRLQKYTGFVIKSRSRNPAQGILALHRAAFGRFRAEAAQISQDIIK